eukprot:90572-Rhodomonas_salina.1
MEVDGHDVYKKDFSVFANLIRGPIGTYVKIRVAKGGDMSKQLDVALERTLNPEMSSAGAVGIDFKINET